MPEIVVYDDENVSSKAILGSRKLQLEEKVDIVLQLGGDPAIATGQFFTKNKMVAHSFISTDVRAQFPYLVVPVESVPFFTGAIEWIAKAYPEAKTMAHVAQDDLIGIEAVPFRRGNELQQFRRLLRPLPGGLESALLIKFGQQLRGRYGNVATIQPARDLHALDFKPQRLGEVCR